MSSGWAVNVNTPFPGIGMRGLRRSEEGESLLSRHVGLALVTSLLGSRVVPANTEEYAI